MDKVRVVVSFQFNNLVSDDIYARLLAFAKAAKNNPGCEQFELLADMEQPAQFSFIELWASADAVEQHTQTMYFKDFVTFLAANVSNLTVRRMRRLNL